jgi:hypothetical protein
MDRYPSAGNKIDHDMNKPLHLALNNKASGRVLCYLIHACQQTEQEFCCNEASMRGSSQPAHCSFAGPNALKIMNNSCETRWDTGSAPVRQF